MVFMKVDRRYIRRGIPLIDGNSAGEIYESFKGQSKLQVGEHIYIPLRLENHFLQTLLDRRIEELNKIYGVVSSKNHYNVVCIAEREFRVQAGLVYRALYLASNKHTKLAKISGLPVLNEGIQKKLRRKFLTDSNKPLGFLRNKNLDLFDLISLMSSEYSENGEYHDDEDPIGFIGFRGSLGAQTLYTILARKNQTYKLEDEISCD